MILDGINNPKDVKKLNIEEQYRLADELRETIIKTVSNTGGHLASNLGVVELSIAIDYVFDFPNDKIVWDVGHQCYVHKLLTGRKNRFDTLRQFGGIAGFPKSEESSYDHFNTGHSSTSISAALGMARARDLNHGTEHIIAVIGDGALTGGMALEALNDAGVSKTNLIVILNDNEMSISKNVGGLSLELSRWRTRKHYISLDTKISKIVKKIPFIGNVLIRGVRKLKRILKPIFISNMFFEDIGFSYYGPVDGHNIKQLENLLSDIKNVEGPVLIHVKTVKGKGYSPAEENPDKFHATGKFDIRTGEKEKSGKSDYSKIFGDKLVELAKTNEKVVAVTAAMKDGTGLTKFADTFPDRFFDVGIAEQHAITMAAGMAKLGLIPVLPIYSSFLQRAYDQLLHDVAMQNLHVIVCADRAGVVGADGETHQGLFDMSFVNTIPNFTIMAPKNFEELEQMLEFAINIEGPVFIRYPRGGENNLWDNLRKQANDLAISSLENGEKEKANAILNAVNSAKIEYGKAEVLCEGNDFVIIAIGKMVARCYDLALKLKEQGINITVINARFLKPLDKETIGEYIDKIHNVITVEDGSSNNGLSQMVESLMAEKVFTSQIPKPSKAKKILGFSKKIEQIIPEYHLKKFSYPEEFIKQGTYAQIDQKYGMSQECIEQYILDNFHESKSKKSNKKTEDEKALVKVESKTNILHKIKNIFKNKTKTKK